MKLLLLCILTAFVSSGAHAQSDASVVDRFHNAMDSDIVAFRASQQAAESVQEASQELAHLHADDTRDVVQYYADKARNKMRGVDAVLQQAEDEAGWSQWWADQAGCGNAESHAANAVDDIHEVRGTWMEAFTKLAQGTGDEDKDALLGYLTVAYNDIKQGIDELLDGVRKLETARIDLKNCYPSAFSDDDSAN
jgi:hypothetical protein